MDVAAAMATHNLSAMNLAASSNAEFQTHEMDDCQNDATVTFTKHTGVVSQRYYYYYCYYYYYARILSYNARTARTRYNKKDAFGVKRDRENEQSRAELSDTVRAKTL